MSPPRDDIQDPTLRFWFSVYSPHRSRWAGYSKTEKQKLIQDHASEIFEEVCRQKHPEAARYWEADLEFDFVRRGKDHQAVVTEVKYTALDARRKVQIIDSLKEKWQRCSLSRKYQNVVMEVLDTRQLTKLR